VSKAEINMVRFIIWWFKSGTKLCQVVTVGNWWVNELRMLGDGLIGLIRLIGFPPNQPNQLLLILILILHPPDKLFLFVAAGFFGFQSLLVIGILPGKIIDPAALNINHLA